MLTHLRTRDFFKAKLSRYVASWVFLSIVLIELIILVPSYFRQQQELLEELEEVSREVLVPLLTQSEYQAMPPDQILKQLSQRRKPNSVILGGALYTPSGTLLGYFGERPELQPRNWGKAETVRAYHRDRYDVLWTAQALNDQYILSVRHDASQVAPQLYGFILRIALLVLVIAIFVTTTTMLTFGVLVIGPILRLRDDLLMAGEAISANSPPPKFQSLKLTRQDELGEVVAAFSQMFQRVSQEISTRRATEAQLRSEQEKSERLLLNVLPAAIATQLKQDLSPIACRFDEVTILFADIVNFTELSSRIPPVDLVNQLNQIFSTFDQLVEKHGLEKIKTIGDAYMIVGGLPTPRPDHASAIAHMALEMQDVISKFRTDTGEPFQLRIGINTGTVVAGVIGLKKFSYDLWGDAVNLASRMESHGIPGKIQVTATTYHQLKNQFRFTERGTIAVKGRGNITTYFLVKAS
ncbi:MAG: adenylate/guanylate cyclase domain-containing protein [Leptolyngbyaceae cyanobacterium bins.302]|nr:adenylate/guanylate cyclase domain-containing protein [Leptolyngbyaceae cyanobacterium bins.302]